MLSLLLPRTVAVLVFLSAVAPPALAQAPRPTVYDQTTALGDLAQIVRQYYYQDVNQVDLYDGAIEGYLSHLDPHSTYISAAELARTRERLEGAFEGIGIFFDILDGFLTVLSPIEGSPAAKAGLLPGDRIIKIDQRSAVGIKTPDVEARLKGPKGSVVHVSVQREGRNDLLEVDITRDKIEVPSVPYAFTLGSDRSAGQAVGYVKLTRFSGRTSEELATVLEGFNRKGVGRIILDLRGNGGGYLEQAVEAASLFLDPDRLVVYTEGRRPGSREDHFASREPVYPETKPLIVLVNSYSASASEIVAGAVQDYDRGLIVGHTTFGKGLVQKQFSLRNGGAVLLTVARYFTPSGRPIQRPFSGDRMSYLEEAHDDYDPNADPDSAAARPIYYTEILKRQVYGSGGITPDVAVPADTLNEFQGRVYARHYVLDFATQNAMRFTQEFADFEGYFQRYRPGRKELSAFREFLESRGGAPETDLRDNEEFLKREIRRQFAQIRWGTGAEGRVRVDQDPAVEEAQRLFDKALALLGSRHYHYNRRRAGTPADDRPYEKVR